MESAESGNPNAEVFAADDWLSDLEPRSTARLIAAAADLALVVDPNGVITDLSYSASEPKPSGIREWVGRPWEDLVSVESRVKVQQMLLDARNPGRGPLRPREVNHSGKG